MSFGGPLLIAGLPSMLGLKAGMRVSVLNPPEGFLEKLAPLPEGVALVDSSPTGIDCAVFFTQKKVELVEKLPVLMQRMAVTGSIWVCFPHAAEGAAVPSEDFVRLAGLELGLVDNKRQLLDPSWTALRLVWKPRGLRPEPARAQA